MNRLHWGQGRVKVYAVRTEIEQLLREEQPIATIYQMLVDAGKIDVAKRTFERHASAIRYRLEKRSSTYGSNVTTSPSSPPEKNSTGKPALPVKFSHSPLPKDDQSDW